MNIKLLNIIKDFNLSEGQQIKLENECSNDDSINNIPWYIRLVTIIGAFFSSLMFVGFIGMLDLFSSHIGLILTGIILITIGIIISKKITYNPIAETFLIAVVFLGQILLAFGLSSEFESMKIVCIFGIIVESLLFILFRSQVHRFISVVLLFLCGLGLVWNTSLFEATHILIGIAAISLIICFRSESLIISNGKIYSSFFRPTLLGLVFALFSLTLLCINNKFYKIEIEHWWISTLFLFACIAELLFTTLYRKNNIRKSHAIAVIVFTAILLSPTIQTPGISAGILILLLGFKNSYKRFIILGTAFFGIFITSFYYSMQISLLSKSYIMLATGFLFIIGYIIVHRRIGANK